MRLLLLEVKIQIRLVHMIKKDCVYDFGTLDLLKAFWASTIFIIKISQIYYLSYKALLALKKINNILTTFNETNHSSETLYK